MRKGKTYKKPMERRITKEDFFIGTTVFIIIFLVFGILESLNDILFLPGAVSTNGTIISCQVVHQFKGGSYCNATISFETQSREHTTFYEAAGDSKEGDTVIVKYHPNNPQAARMDTLPYDLTVACIGFGLFLVDLCIFLYWKMHRARDMRKSIKGKIHPQSTTVKKYKGYKRR